MLRHLLRPVLAVGFLVGYVVGARAGRERYEELLRRARSLAESPGVQGAAGVVSAQVGAALGRLTGRRAA